MRYLWKKLNWRAWVRFGLAALPFLFLFLFLSLLHAVLLRLLLVWAGYIYQAEVGWTTILRLFLCKCAILLDHGIITCHEDIYIVSEAWLSHISY